MEKGGKTQAKLLLALHATLEAKIPFFPLLYPSFSMEKDTAGTEYPFRGSRPQLCPFPAQGKPNLGQTQLPNPKHNSRENLTPSLPRAQHPHQPWNPRKYSQNSAPSQLLRQEVSIWTHQHKKPGQAFGAGIPETDPKRGIPAAGIFLEFHFQSSKV